MRADSSSLGQVWAPWLLCHAGYRRFCAHDHSVHRHLARHKSLFDLRPVRRISAATRVKLREEFAALGLDLKRLFVISVSPTEETSKAIDQAASMGAIGNMDAYVKFMAARAVGDAAQQPGGVVGDTAQMSMGLATGMAAAQAIAGAFTQPQQQAPAAQQPAAGPADPLQALQTLKQLLDNGLITQEEYDAKKADILGRL